MLEIGDKVDPQHLLNCTSQFRKGKIIKILRISGETADLQAEKGHINCELIENLVPER